MKQFIIKFFTIIVIAQNSYSQDIKLSVIYKIGNYNLNKTKEYKDVSTNELISGIAKNINDVEFVLYCNSYSSVYLLVDKLQFDDDFEYKISTKLGGTGVYYTNLKEKVKLNQRESLGEKFNIIYPFNKDKWKITKETKKINGFVCFKAITTREEYNYFKKEKNIFTPEVWFTLDIPLLFGPRGFDGLPGLVLEATNNGKTFIYASEINFKAENIDRFLMKPKKGIDITRDEYLKLLAKKMNE